MKLEKNVFKLSWPIFIEMLFFMLMGSVDTLMLGKYSDLAVAAVGNANTVLNLFGVLLNIVAVGIAVVVSQFLGANNDSDARKTVKTGIVANFAVGVVLFFVIQFFGVSIFYLVNTESTIFDWAISYTKILSWSLITLSISTGISAGFRSYGKPKIVMGIVIGANIVNVILNYLLIFGNYGFPELGVNGAAIGTLVSRGLILIIGIILLIKLVNINPLIIEFEKRIVFKIVKIGVPAALENFTYNFSQLFILAFINQMGTISVAARTYTMLILMYIYIFSLSFASGNSIIVGYYVGEKDYNGAYKRTIDTFKYTVVIVIIMTGIMNVVAEPILSIMTKNQDIIGLVKNILLVAIFLELGRAMNLIFIQALRAASDTFFPLQMAIISMLGVAVVFSYILGVHFKLGLLGVFLALALDETFRGLSMFFRWKKRTWISKTIKEGVK